MLIVSDTAPIIALLKIQRLDLLEKLFDEIKIPKLPFLDTKKAPFRGAFFSLSDTRLWQGCRTC